MRECGRTCNQALITHDALRSAVQPPLPCSYGLLIKYSGLKSQETLIVQRIDQAGSLTQGHGTCTLRQVVVL